MKVIVAGYPKTGTKSMNAALTRLGYTVHDYLENVVLHREEYKKIFNEGWTTDDFRKMYENVDAVTDIPACLFWDEIHKAFPEAKIILTIRDSEEVWVDSYTKQFSANADSYSKFLHFFSPTLRRALADVLHPAYSVFIGRKHPLGLGKGLNKELAKKSYRTHNCYVERTAPKDKLLIYQCSEGWGPLCNFLEVPIPPEPFPRMNVNRNYYNEIADHPIQLMILKEVKVSLMCLAVSTGAVLFFASKLSVRKIAASALDLMKFML